MLGYRYGLKDIRQELMHRPIRTPPPKSDGSFERTFPRYNSLLATELTLEDMEYHKKILTKELWSFFMEMVNLGSVNEHTPNSLKAWMREVSNYEREEDLEEKRAWLRSLAMTVDCIESHAKFERSQAKQNRNIQQGLEKMASLLQDPMLKNQIKEELKDLLKSVNVPNISQLSAQNIKFCKNCNHISRDSEDKCQCGEYLIELKGGA